MKNFKFLFIFAIFATIFAFNTSDVKAQSSPVLYFCEEYNSSLGEIGISDRFTTGYLTVMVKASSALGLSNVSIQFDKYNCRTNTFEYNKKFPYTVSPSMDYIYFAGDDLSFDSPGIYRVFLLDENNRTVASS